MCLISGLFSRIYLISFYRFIFIVYFLLPRIFCSPFDRSRAVRSESFPLDHFSSHADLEDEDNQGTHLDEEFFLIDWPSLTLMFPPLPCASKLSIFSIYICPNKLLKMIFLFLNQHQLLEYSSYQSITVLCMSACKICYVLQPLAVKCFCFICISISHWCTGNMNPPIKSCVTCRFVCWLRAFHIFFTVFLCQNKLLKYPSKIKHLMFFISPPMKTNVTLSTDRL